MSRSKSSKEWLRQHENDPYVKRARAEGWRSRSAFKLLEIQRKASILKPSDVVVDLGAAPGSWCQVVRHLIGDNSKIIAVDLLEMDPIINVDFIQGDFTSDECLATLQEKLCSLKINTVLSDMAPNASGHKFTDQVRSIRLAELALDFAQRVLLPGGAFVCKLFHGTGFDEYVKSVRPHFDKVIVFKPKSSKPQSREAYLVARGFIS